MPMQGVTRVEVIDSRGRCYVNWKAGNKVELSLQDEGRTLKVFISERQADYKNIRHSLERMD